MIKYPWEKIIMVLDDASTGTGSDFTLGGHRVDVRILHTESALQSRTTH